MPLYFISQILGSFLASGTLYLLFEVDDNSYFGTRPAGPVVQSLVFELLATFILMFVICAVSTDKRAVSMLHYFTFSIFHFIFTYYTFFKTNYFLRQYKLLIKVYHKFTYFLLNLFDLST